MGTRVFIGNLPYEISNDDLHDELSKLGHIPSEVKVITDRETGRGRGFAFAEFGTEAAANAAIGDLNGSAQIGGRTIKVDQASERPARSNGGGGGGGGGRGGGGGGGRGGGGRQFESRQPQYEDERRGDGRRGRRDKW